MPRDLAFLAVSPTGFLTAQMWPRPAYATAAANVVQRVYKSLMTVPGDDAFDPTFGAALKQSLQGIPAQSTVKAREILSAVFRKCEDDVRSMNSNDTAEQLRSLQLTDVVYDPDISGWRIDVVVLTADSAIPVSFKG